MITTPAWVRQHLDEQARARARQLRRMKRAASRGATSAAGHAAQTVGHNLNGTEAITAQGKPREGGL